MLKLIALIAMFLLVLIVFLYLRKENLIVKEQVDWKSLEFQCVKEKNPPIDEEADVWFKKARAIEKGLQKGSVAEMVGLYEQAIEKKHYKALVNLANIYAGGDGVKRDEKLAVKLIERAIKLEAPVAYYNMGVYLQDGTGVKQDDKASLSYYRRSADMGSPYGQYIVGGKLLGDFRQFPEKDQIMPIGIQMLECSLGQGFIPSGLELGHYYANEDEDQERGLVLFHKTAKLGSKQALFNLFSAFDTGRYNTPVDEHRASCYYTLYKKASRDNPIPIPDLDELCPPPEEWSKWR